MTVDLGGLTSGLMYYCKTAATNTDNSTNCFDPVIGGVKMFFILKINFPLVTADSGMYIIKSNQWNSIHSRLASLILNK